MYRAKQLSTIALVVATIMLSAAIRASDNYDIEIERTANGTSFAVVTPSLESVASIGTFINEARKELIALPEDANTTAIVTFKYPAQLNLIATLEVSAGTILSVYKLDENGKYSEEPYVREGEAQGEVDPLSITGQIWVAAKVTGTPAQLVRLYDNALVAVVDVGPIDQLSESKHQIILSRPVHREYLTSIAQNTANKKEELAVPKVFELNENYPNPFNPVTDISFDLPAGCHVSLEIFNTLGQKIETVVDEYLEAGQHSVQWHAERFSSGVYLYRLSADKYVKTRKMILLK